MNLMADILINVVIAFLAGSLLLGLHRKVMARVQLRPGPPIVQYLLHSLKFFFKEVSFPKTASMPFYIGITVILVFKIVEHNSGSSSGSPYGKLSCVRAVFSAAGELPLFAVIGLVFLKTGSMNIADVIAYQSANGPLIMSIPLAAIMLFALILTKSPYSPFAITKGKDIVSGFETEHYGVLRGYIMFSESIAFYILLWLFLTLFFGPMSVVGYVIGMILITVITGVINAITPMLNPNHSVMSQITIAIVCIAGTVLMLVA